MIFASDNWAGAHPAIAAALSKASANHSAAYGNSDLDRQVAQKFNEIFEQEVSVFFVGTGTAANSLALAAVNRPGGIAFCHSEAHLITDEGGAAEYLTGGARLCPVSGALGRMTPDGLRAAIERYPPDFIHYGQPMAVSITQSTEIGTIYTPDQISEIASICRDHGLPLHMDGARFANALVACDVSPAQMTRDCGVDLLSFGATKNGCWCAEALVFLNPESAIQFPYIRKRAAHLFSKSRFIAAQFDAYLKDGLWLEMAIHANEMAASLAGVIQESNRMRLAWPCQANEVFAIIDKGVMAELIDAGARFHPWSEPADTELALADGETLVRLVTSFATTREEIEGFAGLVQTR